MKKQNYILIGMGIIGVLALLSIPLLFWFLPYMHDRTLENFSEPLLSIPLPAETQKVNQITKVGQQIAQSDHCDYLAATMLKTNLNKSDIENYYKTNYKGESQVQFFWIDQEGLRVDNQFEHPTAIYTLRDWLANKSKEDPTNLVVYIFEVGMTSSLDFRCS